jgi:hypothetical protein
MVRMLVLSAALVAGALGLSSCQSSSTSSPDAASAVALRDNDRALVTGLLELKAKVEERRAARVAGRVAATEPPAMPTYDFGAMSGQIRAALEAEGVCRPFIDFVMDLLDLIDETMDAETDGWTEAQYVDWENRLLELLSVALECLEPLIERAESGEILSSLSELQSFDRCICGSEGGSIFGTSAALVYSTYGAPSSPGGETYTAPGGPAGDGYGRPSLFP